MKKLILLLALCVPAFAQHTFPALDTNNVFTGQNNLPLAYTVATLPAAPISGMMAVVTDGLGFQCAVGGGTTIELCRWNGASWVLVGADNLQASYTVASLPANPATGMVAVVTDANGANCTTGGGTTLVICRYSGTSWALVSGGGGTGGGNVNGTNLTLNQLLCGAGSSNIAACSGTGIALSGGFGSGILRVTTGTGALSSSELSGDVTTSGSNVTTVGAVNGTVFPASPGVNTVPVVTSITPSTISYEQVPNAALANPSFILNGVTVNLGDAADVLGTLQDSNGNPTVTSTATASAVDSLNVTNAAAGNPATVTLAASGSDANININIASKGTGLVLCNGVSCGGGGGGGVAGSTQQYQINNAGTQAGSSSLINSNPNGAGTVEAFPASDIIPLIANCFSGGVNDCFQVYGQGSMSTPSAATLSDAASGTIAQTDYAKIACLDPLGRTTVLSAEAGPLTIAHALVVTPPATLPQGCVAWLPYATSGASGTETLQVASGNCTLATGVSINACATTAAWTEPAGGIVAGAAAPGSTIARVKNFWVDASGNVNFSGNVLGLGSNISTAQGHLDVHGGNTSSLPGYITLLNNADAVSAYMSASGSNGQVMLSSSTPGADDPTKYIQTASSTATFTNKTYDTAGAGNVFKVNGNAVSAVTGTGSTVVLATAPTITGMTIPAANGITFAEGAALAGSASNDLLYGTTSHRLAFNNNNAGGDVVLGAATTDTLTNKTFDTAGTGNVFKINGTQISSISGNTSKVATAGTISGTALTCGDGSGNLTTVGCSSGAVTWNGISAAAANATINNAGFTTTFQQSSGLNWIWSNTTNATSTVGQNSPAHVFTASYWNGSAGTADSWTLQNAISGTPPNVSTFTLGHSGAPTAYVQMPNLSLPEGSAPTGIASSDVLYGDSTAHRVKMLNNNGSADVVVGAATTDTLTNKTLTNPKINQIEDVTNGLEVMSFTPVASATDSLAVAPGTTAAPTITLTATGSDSNININLVPKGTGTIQCNGVSCGGGGGSTAWSAITNPAGNLTLSMAGDTSEFDYSSALSNAFLFNNNTSAPNNTTPSNSPQVSWESQFFNGTASTADTWSFATTMGTGSNTPTSEFALTHSGTSGAARFVYPGVLQTPNGVTNNIYCGDGGASSCGITLSTTNGGNIQLAPANAGQVAMVLGGSATAYAYVKYGSSSPTVDAFTVNNSSAVKLAGIGEHGSFNVYITNDTTTGTTVNTLTKLTGAPSAAVIAATTDTSGIVGITVNAAGKTSAASVATSGIAQCVFDGATTAGDYVQISSTTGGDCHDAGATRPASNEIIGRVLTTNAGTGTYDVILQLQNE